MTKRTDPQFKVRLEPDMDVWIEEQARANRRTKTAEVAYRLGEARKAAEQAAGEPQEA